MRHTSKTIIATGLIAVAALPIIMAVAYLIASCKIKSSVEEKFQSKTLIIVKVPVDDVIWNDKDKELYIDGKLFDVKTFSKDDAQLTAIGFFDEDENNLIKNLTKTITENDHARKNMVASLIFTNLFFEEIQIQMPCQSIKKQASHIAYKEDLFHRLLHTFSPPPEIS